MSTTITLTNSPRLAATMAKLRELPEVAVLAVVRGMAAAGQIVLGAAVKHRFTGRGPFPVADHRLGVVTNRLRKSLRVTAPQVDSDRRTVSQRFGSNVIYFGLHEFGFKGRVQVRGHTRKAVADGGQTTKGKVTRGEINKRKNNILVKDRGNYSYVKPHTRNLTIAARAPLTTELESQRTRDAYFSEIGQQLRLALKAGGGPA